MGSVIGLIDLVLSRLKEVGFKEALVAGGALRDIHNGHGHDVKDIDVFIKDRPIYLTMLITALHDFDYRLAVPMHVTQYMQFEGVVAVHEFISREHPELPPVQIVVMKENRSTEPSVIIARHDYGICQIGYDGQTLYRTPAYDLDQKNHTFTLVRCRDEKDHARSMKRWERLHLKYPDWSLNDPTPV